MWYCRLNFFPWIPHGYLLNGSLKDFVRNRRGLNIIQFRSISVTFGSMYFFYFKASMLELQKIFPLVRFFNQISCSKGLKAKISHFFTCFFCLNSLRLECSRCRKTASFLTKICIHGTSWMERKHGKCWKLPIFEGRLWIFISYLSEMKTVSMFCNSCLF